VKKNTSAPSRRAFFGLAAKGAVSVVVSQSLLGCTVGSATDGGASEDLTAGGSNSTTCVGTAALTEGPYFVDERLLRSDIRADPTTGAIAAGVPLTLRFNVSRVTGNSCAPLTGAYLDVWHCDAAGVYSDVGGSGAGRKFLRGYQITDANGAESLTSTVHANSPYNSRGQRNTLNSTDGIYNSLSAAAKSALTLATSQTSNGYAGIINLGVAVG
jgi:hypothetical protein